MTVSVTFLLATSYSKLIPSPKYELRVNPSRFSKILAGAKVKVQMILDALIARLSWLGYV